MDTRVSRCSWAGRTNDVKQRRLLCLPTLDLFSDMKIEMFTMSTTWSFICNFENLSKVAHWVSFEPKRLLSTCLLFSPFQLLYLIIIHPLRIKKIELTLSHYFETFTYITLAFYFFSSLDSFFFFCYKVLHQLWPFPTLTKAALPVRGRHKW